ncbi:MAG: AAA family ATPase [Thermoplasmatales archaeon]|nr:MAG: AAA family ATPase [Thermoplasmatales archaeon]
MTVITISGTPGSGKSTVAKILEKRTKLKYVNSGIIFREMAKNYNMSLERFGVFCEKNEEIDKEVDNKQLNILKEGRVILEGRLAGWIAHHNKIPALKVMIDADVETRTKRILKREKRNIKDIKKEIIEREKSEAIRYKKYYDIDLKDVSIYDLFIDSTDKNPEKIVELIIKKIGK